MTSGVMYFNHGEKCLCRLAVSIFSLRKHYKGPVALVQESEQTLAKWVKQFCAEYNVQIVGIESGNGYGLLRKAGAWRFSPFDKTMFIDSDTVILGDVSEFLKMIDGSCVVTKFSTWGTSSGRMARRIKAWECVDRSLIQDALKYGHAINTGVMGWVKGSELLPQYEKLTAKGSLSGVAKKTLDEIAMQLLVPKHKHVLAEEKWNSSCVYGVQSPIIIHYHGQKHCRKNAAGDIWKQHFNECAEASQVFADAMKDKTGDKSVEQWKKERLQPKGFRHDMTIVTAVNPKYADKFIQNVDLWMQTEGLKNQRWLVFVNGFSKASERAFTKRIKHCDVVRWSYPKAGATDRETMLSAFVFGVAKHVKTDYWMKLDCDTKPKKSEWKWPKYRDFDIVSHKWGYTKMKGDASGDHWFETLEKLFPNETRMFSRTLNAQSDLRISHMPGNPDGIKMRFASFAHIERTSFTKSMVEIIRKMFGDTMPIPSQDTMSWYFAERLNASVRLVNMKEYFQP